jgi:hypothetical protein
VSSLPGLTIGIILAIFQCFGKRPPFKHSLLIVIVLGILLKIRTRISLVIPSGPGAFLGLNPSIVRLTSSWVNSESSVVSIGFSVSLVMVCVVLGDVFWDKIFYHEVQCFLHICCPRAVWFLKRYHRCCFSCFPCGQLVGLVPWVVR